MVSECSYATTGDCVNLKPGWSLEGGQNEIRACRGRMTPAQQFLAKESKKRTQTSKFQATHESERLTTSHRQNDAELCIAAHHARVSLGRFFERIGFNHGTHAG